MSAAGWISGALCAGGETGRHRGVGFPRLRGHAGSNPVPRTYPIVVMALSASETWRR